MNRYWTISFAFISVVSLLLPPAYSFAAEDAEAAIEEAMAKLVALGPGVHNIQKDKKGRITSCVVVGQARISTVLGKAKGSELARDKANLACSAEFVKWLKEEVTAYQSNDDETVVLLEGTEGADDESLKESAKSVEKSSTKMESLSKGLVRGLLKIHNAVDGEGKTYTIVKGWKADTADGVKRISANLESEDTSSGKSTVSSKEKSGSKKKIDKKIESGRTTSESAADFLPKKK